MLKLLIGFAFCVAAFNAGIYLYGLTLPGEWHVERSILIRAAPSEIYPLVETPKEWPEWSPWSKRGDATAELEFEGAETGKGAIFSWQGETLGIGRLTLVSAEPDAAVTYRLRLGGADFSKNGRIELHPLGSETRVVWIDGGDLGGTLGRIFRRRLEESVAADFAASLKRLKTVVEERRASVAGPSP